MAANDTFGKPVSFRMSVELKAKLEACADRANRSLSAEMLARLERSIEDDSREPLRRDPMLRMISAAVELIQRRSGRSWWSHFPTADACKEAISDLMVMLPTRDGAPVTLGTLPIKSKDITGAIIISLGQAEEAAQALGLILEDDSAESLRASAGREVDAAALAQKQKTPRLSKGARGRRKGDGQPPVAGDLTRKDKQ